MMYVRTSEQAIYRRSESSLVKNKAYSNDMEVSTNTKNETKNGPGDPDEDKVIFCMSFRME